MARAEHLDVENIAESAFDSPLGDGTGAGVIFGATGGVMEAALRSAYFLTTGENPSPDAFREVRDDGTISPPRNPARMVSTVSTSFQKKSSVLTFPCSIACAISPVPAPM